MIRPLIAFACGLMFAAGLGIAQMTDPARVIGFLNFFGGWDPTLMFVMGGAIGVLLPVWLLMRGRKPVFGVAPLPRRLSHDVDARLVGGSVLFGVGWGLSGVCPGPGVVLLARPSLEVFLFVAAMLAGMALNQLVPRKNLVPKPA